MPRIPPLQTYVVYPRAVPAHAMDKPEGMRRRPRTTWRVQCEPVRRQACLPRKTPSPGRSEPKTAYRPG